MSKMQDEGIRKGREAAAIHVLQKLYESRTVNNVANDAAVRTETEFF